MGVQASVHRFYEWLTGSTVIHHRLPRGVDLHHDIRTELPSLRPFTIFDVGANVGQTAIELVKQYPKAAIHCFEPSRATFLKLQERVARHEGVRCHNLALASRAGQATMALAEHSELNRLVLDGTGEEAVQAATLDEFCASAGIAWIDILKIDTEGADLDVLLGGERMLASRAVHLVQVEAGMNGRNTLHVPLERFRVHLEAKGYYLFGLYEQVPEWPGHSPNLRRTNSVFISEAVIAANRS